MKRLPVLFSLLAVFVFIVVTAIAPALAGAADKTITLGFTASQTGKLNVEAIRQINGINLWVEQVNKAGGIKLADGTV